MGYPLGAMNPCILPARGENCGSCLGFCDAIGDEIASNQSRIMLLPWRRLIVDSSVNLLLIMRRSWNGSSMLVNIVIVTCGTGCDQPEERIRKAAIFSELRTNCLVSSVRVL